jgi:hypothetical protein
MDNVQHHDSCIVALYLSALIQHFNGLNTGNFNLSNFLIDTQMTEFCCTDIMSTCNPEHFTRSKEQNIKTHSQQNRELISPLQVSLLSLLAYPLIERSQCPN